MNKRFSLILSIVILMVGASCAQKKDQIVTISTKFGNMTVVLYDETPKHKENFLKLVKQKYYDSLLFHRIIDGFMIQGGDPESKKAAPGQRLGNGGPGYTVEAEFNPKLFHEKGALAAARTGDAINPTKASSGSQFYIVHGTKYDAEELKIDQQKFGMALQQFFQNPENKIYSDTLRGFYEKGDQTAYKNYIFKIRPVIEKQLGVSVSRDVLPELVTAYSTLGGTPMLDGQYTVFGKVIKGLDVIDKIVTQPKDGADRPNEDIRMKITVEEMSRSKVTKLYGYVYPEEKKK